MTFELGTRQFTFLVSGGDSVGYRRKWPVMSTWRLPWPMPEELFEAVRDGWNGEVLPSTPRTDPCLFDLRRLVRRAEGHEARVCVSVKATSS